jgi:hypothetical protein
MSEYELEKFEESIRDKIYSVRGYQVMLYIQKFSSQYFNKWRIS